MKFVVACLLLFTYSLVDGWSTLDLKDKSHLSFYSSSVLPLKACVDKASTEMCKKYIKQCFTHTKINTVCRKTCGDCSAVSPMSCHARKLGCCWDNITLFGPNGEGCPECKDKHPSCNKIRFMCDQNHIIRACPITCGVKACLMKINGCYDDPQQAAFCPLFKDSGFCEIDPDLMIKTCKKTCNLCNDILGIFTGKVTPHNSKKEIKQENKKLVEVLQKELDAAINKKRAVEEKKKKYAALLQLLLGKTTEEENKKETDEALMKLLKKNT